MTSINTIHIIIGIIWFLLGYFIGRKEPIVIDIRRIEKFFSWFKWKK